MSKEQINTNYLIAINDHYAQIISPDCLKQNSLHFLRSGHLNIYSYPSQSVLAYTIKELHSYILIYDLAHNNCYI